MKIALTLPHLPVSGIGTSVAIIEYGLTEAGHTVDVVITGREVGNDLAFAEESGWNLIVPGQGIRFLPHRLKRVAELLNSNEYSMIINNTSAETQLILPCLGADILRIGVMRGLNPDALRHISMNSEYLHAAVGISAEMARVMQEDERIKAPVRLIPNCTRLTSSDFPELGEPLRICYIGRISNPDKNVSILPHIAKLLRASDIKLTFEIAGDGSARKTLERDFERLSLGCATFKGLLPREQVHQIIAQSNFVLVPSISEGLSNVMLEAMALGCVPVCSNIEDFKWVLGEAASQLQCSLRKPEDYAQRIAYMVNNPDVYTETQFYLRERQQSLFTPEHTVKGYLDLINELNSGDARELPLPVDFEQLQIPKEYREYCSPAWRLLQKAKDMFVSP
jgi:glycosyltransferase involved in cell wall biosynthesis